jgi:hyperosmotically inducible periplasmic protein
MKSTVLGTALFAVGALILTACSDHAAKSAMRAPAAPAPTAGTADRQAGGGSQDRIAREVRHELVMLPYYGVFDNLSYRVDGSAVTLFGQVTRPTLKSDAENVVKKVEGVSRVINNIEVLPLSPNDDRIRLAVYRAVYGQPNLNRYAMQAIPPIHIIVSNGNVTLTGVVANASDRNVAEIQAKSVPGVFSVKNDLQVESGK